MGVATRAKKRRLLEEEERLADRISSLPDGVLGDIVSLLPTKAGARTQVLSSRWRHIWRNAPLNMDLHLVPGRTEPEGSIHVDKISRVLSAHPGPGRRFSISEGYRYFYHHYKCNADALDGWLRSPALEKLQELDMNTSRRLEYWWPRPPVPLPAAVHRFSSTLRVARFSGFDFPDGTNDAKAALHLQLLEQLTLLDVGVSESSLHAFLAGCSLLQSLLLLDNHGFSRLQIESQSLKSVGLRSGLKDIKLEQLLVVNAPCLQRLLFFERMHIHISVISAPRLGILGKLYYYCPCTLEFSTTVLKGSAVVSMMTVVHSVKVIALSDVKLSLAAVINVLKCVPSLEKLYIKATSSCVPNVWYCKQGKPIATLDIRLRKIVLANYQGNSESHRNFAKFFVSNARLLESMMLEVEDGNIITEAWIAKQRSLLNIKKMASRGAQLIFAVTPKIFIGLQDTSHDQVGLILHAQQVHDLSLDDPFQRFH